MFIKLDGKLINLDNVSEVLMSTDCDGKPELRFRDNTGETFESFRLDKVPAAQRAYDYLRSIATIDFDDTSVYNIDTGESSANVFHFDNGDGTIGQMQITNDAPATSLDKGGEWHHASDGTEFPTVYNDGYSFTLESFAESLNLHKVLRQYAVEKESARVRIAELEAVVNEAIQQRDAAYSLYEGKHQRLEQLHRDLEIAREARRALEYVINHAYKELKTYDGDSGAIIAAKLMLEPYTTPVSTED